MSRNYQLEEYAGVINRDVKYYKEMLIRTMQNTFVWKANNLVTTIIQILDSEDVPHLGLLYTVPDQRGNGYATVLTYEVTERVLLNNLKCGLNTDAANGTTNRMVGRIGYEEVYNFINVNRVVV
ncbi:GNAT family N-acetyltransferase [Chitinophaga silvatica]|uniref:GNAT family N-acetyltransferase n=1 Tax=Chitinophaga silvatica TaxID=2282649 RepID=A0A3E1Y8W1_9BACT|nr:GNAT family N-acetyltransferase [Chitinophaga silvatica]RFS21845.1 GNAT family N-acetyltransferase [Chitinophaga silvatica]